ncbi:MAG: hypothetical protein KAH44_15915 [Oricola sp.]|nr:hypothetical protein [Oricola sp.]
MRGIFLTAVACLSLSACVHSHDESAFAETTAVCDTAGVEAAYTYYRDKSKEWRGALGVGVSSGGGAIGIERERNDVELERESLSNRLNQYDAEIDGQFRTVTSACKAYARCMEMNDYDGGECRSSMSRWETAEREFANLSRDLREIDAEVENLRTVAQSRRRGGYRRVNKCEDGVCY